MPGTIGKTTADRRPASGSAALLFTIGGLAAAFGVASCCALPLLLTTVGVSTAWLGGMALIAAPHRGALLIIAALCLAGGTALLWRQQRTAVTCGPNDACTSPTVCVLTLVGLLIGAGLLWAGYAYV